MSEHSGIPVSTLSKVERDVLTLTYDKLQQLSERLNIRMSELFAESDTGPELVVTARRSVGGLEQAVRVKTPNYEYYYLNPELRQKRMIPIVVRIRAKSLAEFGELVFHAGEEFIYVLEGRIQIHTQFYDPVTLEAGQSIYLDSSMGHAYLAAPGCDEATVLGVCTGPDDDLMEALMTLHRDGPTDDQRGAPVEL